MTSIRTDLAMEARELYGQQSSDMEGIESENYESDGIGITRVRITSPTGETKIGKPMGTYITIEAEDIKYGDLEFAEKLAKS